MFWKKNKSKPLMSQKEIDEAKGRGERRNEILSYRKKALEDDHKLFKQTVNWISLYGAKEEKDKDEFLDVMGHYWDTLKKCREDMRATVASFEEEIEREGLVKTDVWVNGYLCDALPEWD